MGRGDKSTRRGKTFSASYGNSRPHKSKQAAYKPTAKTATKVATKVATKTTGTAVKKAPVAKKSK